MSLRQQLPRTRAVGGANPSMMPAANDRRNRFRTGKSHVGQGHQCFGVVIHSGEHQTAGPERQGLFALEQPAIVLLHTPEMPAELFLEGIRVIKAAESRHVVKSVWRFRQEMRLLVIDHLQTVFQQAEKPVRICKLAFRFGGNGAART